MTTTTTAPTTQVREVTPDLLQKWLSEGNTLLVDVREDFEHAEEHIDPAHHHALSKFDAEALRRQAGDRRLVFHCRSGKRSLDAAQRYGRGGETIFHLAGGIEAWKAAGLATRRSARAPRIGVMRQVQMIAGGLVVVGVALGLAISPWWLALSAFVGCGLFFAGATGWCGMALLLGRMPWNGAHRGGASCAA